ncbi:glycosyltransferase family 2 protein [Fusobacterium polymorphum]|uniref:glycosyltransferase family 2 protein n=1 Tax=Fusobacterium nucleatum subsp. polymorphum TaxID=76857 RepID=UPI0030D12B37
METIDILLPVYNGENYLKEQIESILLQSYKNLRLLIRDDNSTDNSVSIINEYSNKDARVLVIKDNFGNLGLVKNIEKLLENSTSEYIMFTDQDDVWFQNKMEKMYELIVNKDKDIPILLHSNCYVTDEKLNIKKEFLKNSVEEYTIRDMFFKFFVQGSSTMINRKLKEHALPFVDNIYVHDRYLHILSEIYGERYFLNEPLMYYRQHSKNLIGSNTIIKKIFRNIVNLSKKFYLEKDKELIETIIKEKNIEKEIFKNYLIVTDSRVSKLKRYKILKNNFNLRLKEKFLFWIR